MTRSELIDEIITHSANGIYDNETDSYSNLIYFRKDLIKLSNDKLINIYCEFCSILKCEKEYFIEELNLVAM